jgi:4'-phosphopantetheinyl transferase EntD
MSALAGDARLALLATRGHVPHLVGTELTLVRGATKHRTIEFSAGRAAARAALAEFGATPGEILQGPGGEPTWPSGLCGSISHAGGVAVALVAPLAAYESVGVDVDDGSPLGTAATTVATKREVALLRESALASDEGDAYLLAFSMKEAVFKCQYPLARHRRLGFRQVRLLAAAPGDALQVAGWRVAPAVGATLREIRLQVHVLRGVRIACAYRPAAGGLHV